MVFGHFLNTLFGVSTSEITILLNYICFLTCSPFFQYEHPFKKKYWFSSMANLFDIWPPFYQITSVFEHYHPFLNTDAHLLNYHTFTTDTNPFFGLHPLWNMDTLLLSDEHFTAYRRQGVHIP